VNASTTNKNEGGVLSFFLFANTAGCHVDLTMNSAFDFDAIATQTGCDCLLFLVFLIAVATQTGCDFLLLLFFLIAEDLNCARFVDE